MDAPNLKLSSTYTPGPDGEAGRYELRLLNASPTPLKGFKLGYSGPGRMGRSATLEGGMFVDQSGSWQEIAAPRDLTLAPGAEWVVSATGLDFALRHWTDGAVAAMVTLADGSVHRVSVAPTTLAGDSSALRRGVISMPVVGSVPESLSIIPWPNRVAVSGNRTAPIGLAISGDAEVAETFRELTDHLFPGFGMVRPPEEDGYPVALEAREGLGEEAYEIVFGPAGATVLASRPQGHLYGLITLGQMARGARLHPESFAFPTAGTIADAPAHGWRGSHFDVARQFYGTAEVAQFLRILAWNKMNRLHWHLSDDEAWRIEIEAYPELTAKAAWRGHGMAITPQLGSGPERSGGFYTKAAARQIIALGERLGIEVLPEIDVPGHCYALLQAIPSLRDPGENGLYHSIQDFPNNCLNPAVETVYGVLETIFAELCALFPSKYFHVGADEVPADAWTSSPQARALLESMGGGGTHELQAHFLRRVQAFLRSRGKITGAWEEACEGGGIDKADCYLVGWRNVAANQRLAAQGYDVVVAPGQHYYLDMAFTADWCEPGANWAGNSTPEQTYRFDPSAGWSADEKARLLGVQACIWSEPMTDRAVFEHLVFPRLSAIAETGWTAPGAKDLSRFIGIAALMPSLYNIAEAGNA